MAPDCWTGYDDVAHRDRKRCYFLAGYTSAADDETRIFTAEVRRVIDPTQTRAKISLRELLLQTNCAKGFGGIIVYVCTTQYRLEMGIEMNPNRTNRTRTRILDRTEPTDLIEQ